MEPLFFSQALDFRRWLEKNHQKETELLVGFFKTSSGKLSISWSQSVDEALCYGWIDGLRKSIDSESYSIRFTPRKPRSIWSAVNIKKIAVLTEQGLIKAAGIESFKKRTENKSKIYSHEQGSIHLSDAFLIQFKAHPKAWAFFISQAPSYQKTAFHVIMSAKFEATRLKRLNELISDSDAGRKLKRLDWNKKSNAS